MLHPFLPGSLLPTTLTALAAGWLFTMPVAAQPAAPAAAASVAREAGPRLRLDAPPAFAPAPAASAVPGPASGNPTEQALAAVDLANAALRDAIVGARVAAQRITLLEQENARLRVEAAQARGAVAGAQARTVASPAAAALPPVDDPRRWLVPLLVALAALAALAAWLGWRVRLLERLAEKIPVPDAGGASGPRRAGAREAAASAPAAFGRSSFGATTVTAPGVLSGLAAAPTAPRDAAPAPRPPTPPPAPRAVTVEELIDLEQQAEFFVALGQDDAATDLLMTHLRESGGTSPLPYLKLLEIARRRGDRAAYERLRERFHARFNARAPEWGSGPPDGRGLEDYPLVLVRLQRAWRAPLDALAELQTLLLRRDAGEPFDLPAYRELLFLYSLARDAVEHAPSRPAPVDVLLPLDAAGDEPTLPARPPPRARMTPMAERPTAPGDLDPAGRGGGFDTLFGAPAETSRRG